MNENNYYIIITIFFMVMTPVLLFQNKTEKMEMFPDDLGDEELEDENLDGFMTVDSVGEGEKINCSLADRRDYNLPETHNVCKYLYLPYALNVCNMFTY